MRPIFKKAKRSKDGGMPFVAIAAVLLILGSAYGVMISQAKDIEDTADSIVTELGSLDTAIDSTETFIERGLGELIFKISTDPDGGPLEKREESFRKLSDQWMRTNFPRADKGVTVSIRDYDFVLEAECLKMASSDIFAEGFTPSFLKATGHYTATFISGSGTSQRTSLISTDGTCALPLVAEKGSLFENMVSGEGSALAQMMTHQLTALAQYRVLNGYGALSEYGSMGTMSIITAEDVKAAYSSSLNVLEMLVFRCASEDIGADMKKVDLADLFVPKDGYVEIDLSAVYSQALISIMDDLMLQWFDYLRGDLAIDRADMVLDNMKNAWDSVSGFFSGKNEFSAAPYIEKALADGGFDADRYRFLFSGKTVSVRTPSLTASVGGNDFAIPVISFTASYPSVDLMEWKGISKFKSDYRDNTNEIREWFRNAINTAAVSIGTSKALGTVRIPVDMTDDKAFMETISETVGLSLKKGESELEKIMTSAIKEQSMADPFCAAIYRVISENRENIYHTDLFKQTVETSASLSLAQYFNDSGIEICADEFDAVANILFESDGVKNTIASYEEAVDGCMKGLRSLAEIPAGKPGVFKELCTHFFKNDVIMIDASKSVPDRIKALCAEAIENTNINPYSGLIDLPGTDRFTLADSGGKTSVEKLSVTSVSSPGIKVRGPNENLGDCVHYVGFNENSGASYSTAFSVMIEDDLSYTVKSSGALESALGISDSIYKGKSQVRIELKIVVASGWELAGVKKYDPSNSLFADAWNVLLKLLGPLLEPLRKVLAMISEALSVLESALIELSKYVAAVVERLYKALMEPL